jgi:hypothetical protein
LGIWATAVGVGVVAAEADEAGEDFAVVCGCTALPEPCRGSEWLPQAVKEATAAQPTATRSTDERRADFRLNT